MAWYDEQLWKRQRAQLEREALATSVEEMTLQNPLITDDWDEESISLEDASLVFPRYGAVSPNLTQPIPALRPQAPPTTRPVAAQRATEQGQRLAGRSTRVRLQAVRPGPAPEMSTGHGPAVDLSGQPGNGTSGAKSTSYAGGSPAQSNPEQAGGSANARPWPRLLGGRGMLKQGQVSVTVPNAAITERCVVTVMLAGNPGPVVVHYVSLHPRMGFTVHLSSQATADAPFNYVIWPF